MFGYGTLNRTKTFHGRDWQIRVILRIPITLPGTHYLGTVSHDPPQAFDSLIHSITSWDAYDFFVYDINGKLFVQELLIFLNIINKALNFHCLWFVSLNIHFYNIQCYFFLPQAIPWLTAVRSLSLNSKWTTNVLT